MNLVRSILSDKKVPKNFWPESVNWTIYVLNRSPTLVVKNVTPYEAWKEVKPFVKHFRFFGCVAHSYVPDARRSKLEDKSFVCVLLGVSEESKGYRLYNHMTKKIVIKRDVVFEEEKLWNWDVSYEEHILMDLECGDKYISDDEDGDENGGKEFEEDIDEDGMYEEHAVEDKLIDFEGSNTRRGRTRLAPAWLSDYVNSE